MLRCLLCWVDDSMPFLQISLASLYVPAERTKEKLEIAKWDIRYVITSLSVDAVLARAC